MIAGGIPFSALPVPADPQSVMERLSVIEHDLAMREHEIEFAADQAIRAKREREHERAVEFMRAEAKTIAEREAIAAERTALLGVDEEARWEGAKAVLRVLEARASTLQSILRAQSRV